MKIEVNIEKKYALAILGLLIVIASLITGYAFTQSGTGGTPSNMGHSVDEIDWSKTINSNLNVQGNLNLNGNLSSSGVCIAGNCKTNWSQVSTSGGALSCTTAQSAEFCGPSSSGVANCPPGYLVTGGGYGRTKWAGRAAYNSFDRTEPAGEGGWSILVSGNNYAGDCWVAYARCCKLI